MRNTRYELNDTIVAVSSPTSAQRVIIRISGAETVNILQRIFNYQIPEKSSGLMQCSAAVDDELRIDAKLYLFAAPHSYTGETLAEIHLYTNPSVTRALMENVVAEGVRTAGPGEFTARAYLNSKIDLAQAEAVNEIITSSNRFQLAAAEKLLGGRLAETTAKIRSSIVDCLSLIEAGLDFSGEDIEFITRPEAVERVGQIKKELEKLLSGSICYESVIDLPAVGIAGAPNAGKSSLLNKLLGQQRSIVSAQHKTTRDVLTCVCTLTNCRCVLFDCAGLIQSPDNILDELAQEAAVEALRNASVVVFCVDVSKKDWSEDLSIRQLIKPEALIPIATKSDLLSEETLDSRPIELNNLFSAEFLPTSTVTDAGLEQLRDRINKKLIHSTGSKGLAEHASGVALTARHKQAVTEAIENINESVDELKSGNDEVAAMMLRAAHRSICDIEQQPLDEQILDRIFSRFCIGK